MKTSIFFLLLVVILVAASCHKTPMQHKSACDFENKKLSVYPEYSDYEKIHWAAFFNDIECARVLVNKDGSSILISKTLHNKITPLEIAVKYGNAQFVEFLFGNSVDYTSIRNSKYRTPVHMICLRNCPFEDSHDSINEPERISDENTEKILNLLLDHGFNIDQQDIYYDTPLHIAVFCGDKIMIEILKSRGARTDLKDIDGFTPLENTPENRLESVK